MEDYIRARSDVFFTGPDGIAALATARSARPPATTPATCSSARRCRSTSHGNSSTATLGRIAGFGGAPNMGADARGRRHASPAWLKAGREARAGPQRRRARRAARSSSCRWSRPSASTCSRRSSSGSTPGSWRSRPACELPPIMIYGDDVTHIVTEEGIANLLLCRSDEEREQAIRGVAGYTPVGLARDRRTVENLRDRGVIRRAAGPRHRPARRHPRPAGGALDEGPGALRPAACTSRRGGSATGRPENHMSLHGSIEVLTSATAASAPWRRSRRCSSASSAPGNLEVLIEPRRATPQCRIARRHLGTRLRHDLAGGAAPTSSRRHVLAGVAVSINDMGATPAVVSLRLDQAVAELRRQTGAPAVISYCRMRARASDCAQLLDAGSFHELLPPAERVIEPAPGAARRALRLRRRRGDRPRPARRPAGVRRRAGRRASWAAASARCTAPSWSGLLQRALRDRPRRRAAAGRIGRRAAARGQRRPDRGVGSDARAARRARRRHPGASC